MSDTVELLPCPFCGGEAKWISGGPGCAYVSCQFCPAETGDGSISRIAAAWNTRAPSPDAALLAAEMQRRAVETAERFRDMCGECAWPEEAVIAGGGVANDIANEIAAIPLPTSALAAAMQLPEVRAVFAKREDGAFKFLRHNGLCALIGGYGYCNCGLDDALAALEGDK